jgi:hypothetical protein
VIALSATLQPAPGAERCRSTWARAHGVPTVGPISLDVRTDAPAGTRVRAEVHLHLPADLDLAYTLEAAEAEHWVLHTTSDLPAHAPEDRGYAPGPHGHTWPALDVLVQAGDVYHVHVVAGLHPYAAVHAEGTTRIWLHLALAGSDGALNREETHGES